MREYQNPAKRRQRRSQMATRLSTTQQIEAQRARYQLAMSVILGFALVLAAYLIG